MAVAVVGMVALVLRQSGVEWKGDRQPVRAPRGQALGVGGGEGPEVPGRRHTPLNLRRLCRTRWSPINKDESMQQYQCNINAEVNII